MDDWVEVKLSGFTIHVPGGAEAALDGDGATFIVRLPTDPTTELLVSRHEATGIEPMPQALYRLVESFFLTCAPGGPLCPSIEPADDAEHHACILQGVAKAPGGDWWFVRGVAIGGTRDYYKLQWCGPSEALESVVLRMAVSFQLDGTLGVPRQLFLPVDDNYSCRSRPGSVTTKATTWWTGRAMEVAPVRCLPT